MEEADIDRVLEAVTDGVELSLWLKLDEAVPERDVLIVELTVELTENDGDVDIELDFVLDSDIDIDVESDMDPVVVRVVTSDVD